MKLAYVSQHPFLATAFFAATNARIQTKGQLNADFWRNSLRSAAVQKSPRIYDHGRANAGIGNRSDDRDLYAGAPGDVEVAASDQREWVVEDRR